MKGKRGFFGVAVFNPKREINIGTLWRTANIFGASFIATIGARYKTQASDTTQSQRHIPLYHYKDFETFHTNMPQDCQLIGIEMETNAIDLACFNHPQRAVYLLGAEDSGIPQDILSKCHQVIKLQGEASLNVATAGSIVIYHRTSLQNPTQ